MKLIDVSTKKFPNTFAMVDDEDYEKLSKFRWAASKPHNIIYAVRWIRCGGKQTNIRMHREILGVASDIDHIDCDGLNNQRHNLRPCTPTQNAHNQPKRRGSSKMKGVSWHKHLKKWRASIVINGRQKSLGYFHDEADAARRYDAVAIESFGEFARTNNL